MLTQQCLVDKSKLTHLKKENLTKVQKLLATYKLNVEQLTTIYFTQQAVLKASSKCILSYLKLKNAIISGKL